MNALQSLVVPLALVIVIVSLLAPLVIWSYRRRIRFWMRKPSALAPLEPQQETSPAGVILHVRVDKSADARAPLLPLARYAESALLSVAIAYLIAGLVHAVLTTLAFAWVNAQRYSAAATLTALVVFSVPAVATALYVYADARRRLVLLIAILLVLFLALPTRDLAWLIFRWQLLAPTALLLLFTMRFWRGIAPLLLLVVWPICLVWTVGFGLAKELSDAGTGSIWIGRLLGLAIGAACGYGVLRQFSRWNERGQLGDQELFIHSWWFLYTAWQVMFFSFAKDDPAWLGAMVIFAIYLLAFRLALRALCPRAARVKPLTLLLLRVFGYDRRTDRLFEELERRWRFVGRIMLISGLDLALRTIRPLDFLDFVRATLYRRFVSSQADLDRRLAALSVSTDPDGRYRGEAVLCGIDTWRPAMRALEARSDVVLMDLRGFTRDREGCRYELLHLARSAPTKKVVLLAATSTELAAIAELLGARADEATSAGDGWLIIQTDEDRADRSGPAVFAALVGAPGSAAAAPVSTLPIGAK